MKEAREVIAGELFRLLMEGEGMRSDDDADSILSALDSAGYVVIHKDNGEAFEQRWLSYLGVKAAAIRPSSSTKARR